MRIYLQLVLGQMSDVVVSVGQYERHSLPWSLLASDFMDHAKYQVIQQVSQLTISISLLSFYCYFFIGTYLPTVAFTLSNPTIGSLWKEILLMNSRREESKRGL